MWLTADGVAVLDHDGVVGGRLRRTPIARTEAQDLPETIPSLQDLYREAGSGFELSLDVKDPAAIDQVVAIATDVGDEARSRLWLCHPDLALLRGWRARWPDLQFVHSTRIDRLERGPEPHAAELADLGIRAVNLHHADWTGGHIALYHRFGVVALAWDLQFERVLDEMLDAGIDGVFGDHVDHLVTALDRIG